MISILLNDEVLNIARDTKLSEVLSSQDIAANGVALVLNAEVIPRSRWQEVDCQQNDKLEIFSVVAGG